MVAVMDVLPSDRVSPLEGIGKDVSGSGNSRSALKQAGLDWTVRKVPMKNSETGDAVPGFFQVMREDNHEVVGVVEGQYKTLQNHEFFDIADVFVDNGADISRLAYIHKSKGEVGGMIYMNLRWPFEKNSLNIVGDIVGKTAVIRNSHDGKTAALVRMMLLRLACVNGMVVPVPGFSYDFRICHTESAEARMKEAEKVLSQAPKYWNGVGEVLSRIAKERITPTVAKRLTHMTVAPSFVDNPSKMSALSKEKCDTVLRIFKDQPGANTEAIKGTAYGWFNAVTDYADHKTRIKTTAGFNEAQQRFKSSFDGNGALMKLNAWKVINSEFSLN